MTDDRYRSDPEADAGAAQTTLPDLWATVRRSRWLVLGITAATVALAAVLTIILPPTYESEASVRIVSRKPGADMLGGMGAIAGLGLGLGQDEVETEIGVLESRRIVYAVAESLALHVTLVEPDAPRDQLLRVLRAPQDAVPGAFRLTRRTDGIYDFAVDKAGKQGRPDPLPAEVRTGVPFRIGPVEMVLSPRNTSAPQEVRFTITSFPRAMEGVAKRLEVGRARSGSQLVEVRYRDRDPVMAAAVPNAITRTFIGYKEATSNTESRSMASVLREQVDTYGRQLRDAEDRLRAFREQQQVVNPEAQSTEQIKRLARFQAERDALTVERESLAALLADIARNEGESPSPARRLASFPSFIANGAVQDLLGSLTELETERSKGLVLRREGDPGVAQLTNRIRELEDQLHQLGRNYLTSLDRKTASTDAVLGRFGTEVEQIPARELEFGRLFREQEMLTEVYVLLQTKLKEAEVKEAVDPGDVRILDTAVVPDEPISPKPLINLSLALLMGMLLGLAVATGRDVLNTKVRTREDARAATGGLPVLGIIPPIGETTRRRSARRLPEAIRDERLVTRRDPANAASEAYRNLRTSITFIGNDRKAPRLIVVTSALPGDGKSTSAANLAITLAQQGTRTLLVDADLRSGSLHELFGTARDPGLSRVLLGDAPLAEAIGVVETGAGGQTLDFLPAGALPANPADLLGSARMKELVRELRGRYEAVIFDAPPLHAVADAAVLGSWADATLLVARAGATERAALEDAATRLRDLRTPVGGVVINDSAGVLGTANNGRGANGNGRHT